MNLQYKTEYYFLTFGIVLGFFVSSFFTDVFELLKLELFSRVVAEFVVIVGIAIFLQKISKVNESGSSKST